MSPLTGWYCRKIGRMRIKHLSRDAAPARMARGGGGCVFVSRGLCAGTRDVCGIQHSMRPSCPTEN